MKDALPRTLAIAGTLALAGTLGALAVARGLGPPRAASTPSVAALRAAMAHASCAPPPPAPVPAAPPVAPPSAFDPCTPLDLDGDGVADRLDAIPESCGTGGCVYEVRFVRPGGDDVSAGEIEGHCPFAIVPRAHGPADIIAHWRLGATEDEISHYRFRGHRYRALR